MTFGDVVKELRKRRGLGIKPLAHDLGLNYTYLSKIENNKALPSKQVIERIAEYFNYDLEKLSILARRVPTDLLNILAENPETAPKLLRGSFNERRTFVGRVLSFFGRLKR